MKREIIQRAFDHLRPGGWLECQEIPATPDCDDGTMTDDYEFLRWARELVEVSRLANRQMDIGGQLKDWMREVGFVDVHETVFKIPINGWPREPHLKHIGMLWQRNLLDGLSGFTLSLFNNYLGKTVEEIEVSLPALQSFLMARNILKNSCCRCRYHWLTCGEAFSTSRCTPTTKFMSSVDGSQRLPNCLCPANNGHHQPGTI